MLSECTFIIIIIICQICAESKNIYLSPYFYHIWNQINFKIILILESWSVTHLCPALCFVLTKWVGPFVINGWLVKFIFRHFYFISKRNTRLMQLLKTLIIRLVLRRLIRVCIFCFSPINERYALIGWYDTFVLFLYLHGQNRCMDTFHWTCHKN